jgi:biotin synthase
MTEKMSEHNLTTRMTLAEITAWLRENDAVRLAMLWQRADQTRQQTVGGEVYLRGLIELSNHCVRLCAYCGLRADNRQIERYRMSADEVIQCARQAVEFGYGTVVLQSGEDHCITADWMTGLIRRIKGETSLAVTLSLGERDEQELAAWREAGADRYLLRFETSNPTLYDRIHPPRISPRLPVASDRMGEGQGVRAERPESAESRDPSSRSPHPNPLPKGEGTTIRIATLRLLRRLGYEVGSGVMIGIPGQTYDDLARDVQLFGELDLDMIGVGPFLVHPQTPLASTEQYRPAPDGEQAPATELMTYKVIALARLVCPRANIPSTTALATLNVQNGRELGLVRGANVIMPNLTPPQYRVHYEIYPNKACIRETASACHVCTQSRIRSLGRTTGAGRGDSRNYRARQQNPENATGPDCGKEHSEAASTLELPLVPKNI